MKIIRFVILKLFFILTILILISFYLQPKIQPWKVPSENQKENSDLKGPVKLVEKKTKNSDGKYKLVGRERFNREGDCILRELNIGDYNRYEKDTFIYNELGNLARHMQYRRGKLAFVDTVKYDFHQDSSWEKHTIKWYYLSSKPVKDYLSIELYNEDGFLKQTQEHNFYSGSKKYVGITYDSLKNKIESFIIKIDDQGRKDSIIENIDYDKQKQVQYFRFYSSEDTFLIKERYFDMADNIILKREIRIPNDTNTLRYKYNSFGFVIWEHWRSNNELREKSAHTFKYKLDSYNNWTEKNVLYNGRETNHYIRNIYYWE